MVSKLSPSVATAGVQDKITRLTTLAVLTVTMTTSSHTLQLHVVQQLLNYVFEYLTHLNLEEKVCIKFTFVHVFISLFFRRVSSWLDGRV